MTIKITQPRNKVEALLRQVLGDQGYYELMAEMAVLDPLTMAKAPAGAGAKAGLKALQGGGKKLNFLDDLIRAQNLPEKFKGPARKKISDKRAGILDLLSGRAMRADHSGPVSVSQGKALSSSANNAASSYNLVDLIKKLFDRGQLSREAIENIVKNPQLWKE